MAILADHETFMARVKERVGDDTSDSAISFIEDMQDTFTSLKNDSGTDWKTKYEENDSAWRKRYTDRFYKGAPPEERESRADTIARNSENSSGTSAKRDNEADVKSEGKPKTFAALFKEREG